MHFAFRIAWRYLFSKKSHNAINIISGISAVGVAVVTMALVCVLSVFNGFETLVDGLYSTFDPDLKIALVKGKSFSIDTEIFHLLRQSPDVECFTETVEDNALLAYGEKQMSIMVKGVSEQFQQMTRIDSIIYDGKFLLFDGAFERSMLGYGAAAMLGLSPHFIEPLRIYAPRRTQRINMLRPEKSLNMESTFVAGIFSVQQAQYDENYVLVSLNLARRLFEYDSLTVTAVELKLKQNVNLAMCQKHWQTALGEDFSIKNRYEQQESFFRILQIEKWLAFLILCFILLIASFNIIGSLTMLIIDKKDDIITLKNLGANERLIRRIFLFEGWLVSIVGASVGVAIGAALCLLQQHFGLLSMGEGYVVEYFPVVTKINDILLAFAAVIALGFLAAYYPAKQLRIKN